MTEKPHEAQRIAGAGANVIDTAINYRDGESAEIVESCRGRQGLLRAGHRRGCRRPDPGRGGQPQRATTRSPPPSADVADPLGVSSSPVAIAWTRASSRAVHPILGMRTVRQLEGAAGFDVGFPSDLSLNPS